MSDNHMISRKLFAAASLALAALTTYAEPVKVRDFDVYVDLPTAFVFVKLSDGWKFVGKIDAKALGDLPATVHTSLLSSDQDEQTADAGDLMSGARVLRARERSVNRRVEIPFGRASRANDQVRFQVLEGPCRCDFPLADAPQTLQSSASRTDV